MTCPSCRSAIALDDVNVSTDLALCRTCAKSFRYSEVVGDSSQSVSLDAPPAGAWFEQLPDGFRVGATTRSWQALFLIPFTCAWSGMSMYGIYWRQIASHRFDPTGSLLGFPFFLGTCVLVSLCALNVAGKVTVTRHADRLSIFIGVGWLGWTRNYSWSDFRSIREDLAGSAWNNWNRQGRVIILEGARRATFGSVWSEDRRYFVLSAIRAMLNSSTRSSASPITSARFKF